MSAPRRYRLAVLAYPAGYRESRGRELLATLADGDDDRGRPSNREALALAYRGLLQRARIAVTGEGLLVIAAVLVLLTMTLGLTWVERTFLFRGEVAAMSMEGAGRWWGAALAVCAFTVIAAGPFRATGDPRRRARVALLGVPIALLLMSGPLALIQWVGAPTPAELGDYLWVYLRGIVANWQLTFVDAAIVAGGTWAALLALSRMRPRLRVSAQAVALGIAGLGAVAAAWERPELGPPIERAAVTGYAQSAFADLGVAAFVTAAAAVLAIAAGVRAARA